MASERSTHGQRTTTVLAVAFIAAMCLSAAFLAAITFDDGPVYPDEWDPRVVPLIDDVERLRGLEFLHPVSVYFLSAEQYSNLSRNGSVSATDDEICEECDVFEPDPEDLELDAAVGRMTGLLQGEPDLAEASEDLADGGSLAFYDSGLDVINVRGDELTPGLEVTLVHELVHALQDQHFDLDASIGAFDDDSYSAFRSLVEGDAVSIERRYVDTLPEQDRDRYLEEMDALATEAEGSLDDVPSVLQTVLGFYYVMGDPFVDLIAGSVEGARNNQLVDEAFERPPGSSQELMHYPSYAADRETEPPDEPEVPEGSEVLDTERLGASYLFIMLAERIDPVDAMHAVDRLRSDLVTTYRSDGDEPICMALAIEADTESGAEAIAGSLNEWSSEMPSEVNAEVGTDGRSVTLDACDPGSEVDIELTEASQAALAIPSSRLAIAAQVTQAGESREFAWCFADELASNLTGEQLRSDGSDPEVEGLVRSAREGCR